MSSLTNNDKKEIASNISKTGFELEYNVSKKLEDHGWIVINSKYYVDDESEKVREVDIVAYKPTIKEGVGVYTTLIISCKKSDDKHWGFLTKDKNSSDPNMNWEPVDKWTNSLELNYQFDNLDWKKRYLDATKNISNGLFHTDKHVFAYQELDKKKFKARNQSSIYSSISSLIKAMGYELKNLPERRKKKVFYNFNLISIADTSLLDIHFNGKDISPSFVDDMIYIGSFIVNKREIFTRIHFIEWNKFEKKLTLYDQLHDHNTKYISSSIKRFYKDIFDDREKVLVHKKYFREDLNKEISNTAYVDGGFEPRSVGTIYFFKRKLTLLIELNGNEMDEQFIKQLKSSRRMRDETTQLLKKYFRYEGLWEFDLGLPF